MSQTERNLLLVRKQNSDRATRYTQIIIVLGDVFGILLVALSLWQVRRDIKRRQAAEQHLLATNAELADASARAQESDRLKSAFLATMSHELRTPLNSIIGFTGILRQEMAGPVNAEQGKQLDMVLNSARHLLMLINDVLDISKIEAGEMKLDCAPYDLRAAIETVVAGVTPLAAKKGLALSARIAPELQLGAVLGDGRRVAQILINLLSNAIKFTERGAVVLDVQAMPDGHTLRLQVRDSGMGIAAGELDKLFKPFHQVDTGLARQHEGSGLGLAICQRMADMMGGRIEVESQWGIGSTFSFILPLTPRETS